MFRKDPLDLVRRLVVISLEDVVLHPALPVCVWWMMACSKGYVLDDATCGATLLRIVRDLCLCSWRDAIIAPQVPFSPPPPAVLDALPSGALARALITRARFGGMAGDVEMLLVAAGVWAARLDFRLPLPSPLPPGVPPGVTSWFETLHAAFKLGAAAPDTYSIVAAPQQRPPSAVPRLTPRDVPPAGIDFACSAVLDEFVASKSPALAAAVAALVDEFGEPLDVLERLKAACWEHSAGVNVRVPRGQAWGAKAWAAAAPWVGAWVQALILQRVK